MKISLLYSCAGGRFREGKGKITDVLGRLGSHAMGVQEAGRQRERCQQARLLLQALSCLEDHHLPSTCGFYSIFLILLPVVIRTLVD